MATRRAFLERLALGLGVVACRGVGAQTAERSAYVGIETSAQTEQSRARFFSASGAPMGVAPLDFRAHGLAQHRNILAVFPRRPGNRVALVNVKTLETLAVVTAPKGRHFFGHGAFTRDGQYLLVAENDLDSLKGGIGVYGMREGWRRLDQISLPGSGPHEIVRAPFSDRFYVALGGLETHPAYGRTPLNLGDFRSQIVTVDLAGGSIDALGFWPGSEGVSLRHLAVDPSGTLWIGGQVADPNRAKPENVLWRCRNGQGFAFDTSGRLSGYVSSIAASTNQVLVTSKKADIALVFGPDQTKVLSGLSGASAVGLGPDLSAVGGYDTLTLNGADIRVTQGYEFDNHGLVML